MKTYAGTRTIDGIRVTVDDAPLAERRDLADHSANGFEWSYEGAEPSQLAFAILHDHTGDANASRNLTDAFMRAIVANLDNDWVLTSDDVAAAIGALQRRAARRP